MEEDKNKRLQLKKFLSHFSAICGVGGIVFYLYINFLAPSIPRESILFRYDWQLEFYIKFFTLFSMVGIVAGIISSKAKINKRVATIGIILSTLSLLIWLSIWFLVIGLRLEG